MIDVLNALVGDWSLTATLADDSPDGAQWSTDFHLSYRRLG